MRVSALGMRLLAGAGASLLTACSGGGGAAFIPSPPVLPAPPLPSSAEAGALAAPPAGVTATTNFATVGDDLKISWNAQLNAYQVTVPEVAFGKIVQTSFGPGGANGDLVESDGTKLYSVFAFPPLSYTGIIELHDASSSFITAYGVPATAGAVPTTGTATYDAQLDGHAGSWPIYGTAQFQFDFGAGTLSGFMDPHTNGPMESPTLPRYTFTQTVFSPGSTTFSGTFDIAGPTPSSFQGQFTGPRAQELMASFKAPFLDWDANENPTVWNVMEGVMIGKRR